MTYVVAVSRERHPDCVLVATDKITEKVVFASDGKRLISTQWAWHTLDNHEDAKLLYEMITSKYVEPFRRQQRRLELARAQAIKDTLGALTIG